MPWFSTIEKKSTELSLEKFLFIKIILNKIYRVFDLCMNYLYNLKVLHQLLLFVCL